VVCRGDSSKNEEYSFEIHQAFIVEQVKSLKRTGVEIDFFLIHGKGIFSYFNALPKLCKTLKFGYDLIHAHNGLCGVLANFQRKIPIITTYHGSDINNKWLRVISYFAILGSKRNIFVSEKLIQKSIIKRNVEVIPCGVDTSVFISYEKIISKRKLHLSVHKKYILFSSAFSNKI
jgi:glycosyltransferase involved in cell wall biosynthesis